MTRLPDGARAALLLPLAVLTACAAHPTAPAATSAEPAHGAAASAAAAPAVAAAQDVDALTERWFDEYLALNPIYATFLGEHRYDDRFGEPSIAKARELDRALNDKYLALARAIDPAVLTAQQRLTLDVFTRDRRLAAEGYRFPEHLFAFNQMDSVHATLAVLGSGASAQPFDTPAQHEAWLARAAVLPAWIDSAIDAMREGIRQGVTHPRPVAEKLVPQLDQLIAARAEDSSFWGPVRMMGAPGEPPAPGFTAADRERLTARHRTLVEQQLNPAFRRLRAFLVDEYVPAARTSVAWSALPDGHAWYAYAVETQTTVRMDPLEIHALGLAEVARIRGEMEAVRRQVGFDGDLAAFFRHLQTDPRFYYTDPDELLQGYRAVKTRIDAMLPALFRTFPKADYEVRAVEPFRAQSAAGAMYQSPSLDGTRPGIFYVNTFNLKAQPKYGMETLSLHEASPGHHFQIAIQQELDGLPRVRRLSNPTAYAEGWALYAESIGRELGLFTDPYQWYGRLSDEMLRAMRLVVDTGLHAKGWSREQAIRYMLDNSSMAESDVVAEVERYIVWPGQALGYKVGQLRISAMRARAERELGARFDVRDFHDQVLKDGALPLDVLEAKLDRWIAATRAGAA
jgi:uncharacterized protein (DUF885 family)